MTSQTPQASWHHNSSASVLKELESTVEGLVTDEAASRLEKYGFNILPELQKPSKLIQFLLQFHNILIYALLGSAAITAVLDHWIDTFVILAVVVVNALIGFIQERKAERAMDSIRQMMASTASVVRDGQRRKVPSKLLVPGDIVMLDAGDKVPADLRIILAHGLSIQESILTGESIPVQKNTEIVARDSPLGDRSCMAFSGTIVTAGSGMGVVVATGKAAEVGRISCLLSQIEILTTPLVVELNVFTKWLTLFILSIATLLLAFGYFVRNYDFTEIFMVIVGLSVAAIPEGLPAVLTITLAMGVQVMAKRNVIVRHLPAIDTLGSVSVICTDKTGTLTCNEMMVASALTYQHRFMLDGDGYAPKGSVHLNNNKVNASDHAILIQLARAVAMCNDAVLYEHDNAWMVEGDPMEGALLAFSGKVGIDFHKERAKWSRTDAIAFDPSHRFMATLNHDHEGHANIYVKGAPESILSMCKDQQGLNGCEPLNHLYWQENADAIAAGGQRVLAFAYRSLSPKHTVLEHADVKGTLTLLGMVGLIDPPKREAIEAVAQCYIAGIRVVMITGDHAKTAAAIGMQVGLKHPNVVLTGADLDAMNDALLRRAVLECDIFARTGPEHKLRLVMALQSQGMIVAMTGDGVNDAPALKRADVGIAMGCKGSEAAKEISELVLIDDNFASIVAAVREGRTVYDNIKKVISWTLPTNAGESMVIIVALLFGLSLPVTPIQILWINLITAVTLGIALAFEPTEANTMLRPPRSNQDVLLSKELIWHIMLVSVLFLCGVYGIYFYAMKSGYTVELAQTLSVNTLVVMEMFHLFFIRNIYGTSLTWKAVRGTKVLWAVVLIIAMAQMAITYLPALQFIFGTRSVSFFDGLMIMGIGVMLFLIIEIEKQLRLWLKKS